jgi:molybdenum cofactor cytidylyltransferase
VIGAGPPSRVVGLVLAAGGATRFGSDKLAAMLDGRRLLDHVFDALRAVPLREIVIVTRPGGRHPDAVPELHWVENPAPDAGLASSLRIGLAAILELPGPPVDAVLLALGDQPRIDPAVIRQLIGVATTSSEPVVVPRYPADPGRNPVVLRREAFALVREAMGDRGLGPVLDAHPELVHELAVAGANPDVDTPADLARLADESGPSSRDR